MPALANRHWRPIADVIKDARLIRGDRADLIFHHLCTKVTALEAAAIASHLGRCSNASKQQRMVAAFATDSSGLKVC